MEHVIRTFIAFPLDKKIHQAIEQTQNDLKKLDCNIKWVKPSNAHLTLKFLGDVKLKRIDSVKQVLDNLCSSLSPINTSLTQIGGFPNIEHPRILWIGLSDPEEKIAHFVSSLETELGHIGFKKENKPFSPHITIGRTRSPRNLHLLSKALSEQMLPTDLAIPPIEKVILFKSTLTPQGPIYESLHEINLNRS